MSTLHQALSDPGSIVSRRFDVGPEADEVESLTDWQARAVAAWLRERDNNHGDNRLAELAELVEKGEV